MADAPLTEDSVRTEFTEAERLAALARYGILDTEREAAFDDIAELASVIFEAPIAVVNLVADGRQWFKAEIGIGARELPLDVSICSHAILQRGVFVVPDLSADPRFEANPLVTVAGGLRFYAGALLETPDGLPLGTVCVLDTEARPGGVTERQARALKALASQTMVQLEARRSQAQTRESEARLRFLDRLAEATQPLTEADSVMATTARLLAEHLGVSVCAYADMDEDENGFTIRGDWAAPGSTSIVGHYQLADFGSLAVKNLGAGLPLVVNDNLRELAPEEAATFQSIGIAATICMPLIKGGRLTALMAIHDRVPRVWTDEELSLLREVTARSWAHVERVAAAAGLRESEERLRLAVENAEVGFWDLDLVHDALIWPPRTKAMFGISADVPVTMQDFYDGLFPDDLDVTSAAFAAASDPARRALYDVEYRTIGKEDGALRWVAAKGRGVFDESGTCLRVAGTAVDITARKAAEAALRDSEARLRELNDRLEHRVAERTAERNRVWEMSRDLFAIMGFDGRLKAINPAWETTLGRDTGTLLALSFRDQVHPDDHAAVEAMMERLLRGETVERFEDRLRHADGSWRWIAWTLVPEGEVFYAVGRDVTAERQAALELEQAQDALRQSQKMEAMGQLTGGVAHDFNNLLTPIVGSLDMLQRKGLGSEREQRLIAGAVQSADRAKTLVQRLLAFARRQPLQATAVDVGGLVVGMADLVASTSGPQIKVVVEAADDLPAANADHNQLEMALLNLGVNARDAMPDGGTLRITADAQSVGVEHRAGLRPGDYVRLSVADTGVGMDEAVLKRAVEPFFSTKGVGKGTGLGLSMVHGLASQLGGALTIDSRPGVGTNIELWLPVSAAPAEAARPPVAEVRDPGTKGVALLVDDEDLVRMSTADMLADMGYTVVEAESAEGALRMLEDGLAIDVLITDHLMSGMDGTELAHLVRATRPGVKVLIVSGYAEDQGVDADLPRLTKPFRSADLAGKLADLVD
jgi:PAS domain S-box-containing protein